MNKIILKTTPLLFVSSLFWTNSQVLASDILNVTINSPIRGDVTTVEGLILVILNTLIIIAIPIVVLMIIYAGFMYVTARGNAEQIKKATTALTYAIIGAILIIGAVAITGIMEQTIDEFRTP